MQNNNFEWVLRVIIPVGLLIFWALSNLFNREAPRAAARDRMSPLGPRPGSGFPPPRPPDRAAGSQASSPARYPQQSEDIIILRSETNRTPVRTTQNPRRGAGRGRAAQAQPSRKQEVIPSRNRDYVGEKMNTDVNQSITRTMDIRPLTESVTASQAMASSPTRSAATATTLTIGTILPLSSDDLRAIVNNPARLREAFLLNELLQPPVALRGKAGMSGSRGR